MTSRGSASNETGESTSVEHALLRHQTLDDFRRGRLSKKDICDASSELLRVARSLGEPLEEKCPVCDDHPLVVVSFAFGKGLPKAGRGISSPQELARMRDSQMEMDLYLVEVCTECGWNHLIRKLIY